MIGEHCCQELAYECYESKAPAVTALQAQGVCNFNLPLGNVGAANSAPGSPVAGSVRLNFEDTQITASAAITVDSTSIVYTGYTNSSENYFVGAVRIPLAIWLQLYKITSFFFVVVVVVFFKPMQFYITATSFLLTPGNSFYTRMMSSPVRQLQWESGLDYIYVATESAVSVFRFYFYTALPQQCMLQCI